MENAAEYVSVLLYILGFLLALAISIAWIILPFLLMSKLNRIVKALESLEYIARKQDRQPLPSDQTTSNAGL